MVRGGHVVDGNTFALAFASGPVLFSQFLVLGILVPSHVKLY